MSYIIAVAGNNGSGKTTIAKLISKNYDFDYIPHRRIEMNFLNSFFQEPEKWFLETQLSFLTSKAIQIDEVLRER